jgi:hypothetical protein
VSTKSIARSKTRITAADLAKEGNRLRDLSTKALSRIQGGAEDLKYRYRYGGEG